MIAEYNRKLAVNYALKWAFKRNKDYYDFSFLGGDCTNFASQCLFAGSNVMNYTNTFGWYYNSINDRSPSWTGVNFFYKFLINNKSTGPFAKETTINNLEIGDFIQLGDINNHFYHTLIITSFKNNTPIIAAHSIDALNKPLTQYSFQKIRYLHIIVIKK